MCPILSRYFNSVNIELTMSIRAVKEIKHHHITLVKLEKKNSKISQIKIVIFDYGAAYGLL